MDTSGFQPDDALKVLTPWWDLVLKYITNVIITIAVTSTGFQVAKDNLACVVVVGCPSDSNNTTDITNRTCELLNKPPPQLIAFLNSACFQFLNGYESLFSYILLFEAVALVCANNFYAVVIPHCSHISKQFLNIVAECYNSIGTPEQISSVLDSIRKSSNKRLEQDNSASGDTSNPNGSTEHGQPSDDDPIRKSSNERQEVPVDDERQLLLEQDNSASGNTSNPNGSTEQGQPFKDVSQTSDDCPALDNASITSITTVHSKVADFTTAQTKKCFLFYLYFFQHVLQFVLPLIMVIIYSMLLLPATKYSSFKCKLEADVVPVAYSYIQCSRRIEHSFYVIEIAFCFFVALYLAIAFIVLGYLVCKAAILKTLATNNLDFLCFLLKQYSQFQYEWFRLFSYHDKPVSKSRTSYGSDGTSNALELEATQSLQSDQLVVNSSASSAINL